MVFQLKTFCGCQNVEDGSRSIAIVQMFMGAAYAGLSIYNQMTHGIVGGVVVLLLGLFLLLGVRAANVPVLILWIFANVLLIIFLVFEAIVYLSASAGSDSSNTYYEPDGHFVASIVSVLVLCGLLGFHVYSLLVVFSFVRELQGHGMPVFPR